MQAAAVCYLLFTLWAYVTPAVAADLASWPNRGPYQQVGQAGYGAGRIEMPKQVLTVVRRHVQGNPSTWYIVERYRSPGREEHVVCVAGPRAERCLLVSRGTWKNLNDPANLPSVRMILGPLDSAALRDHHKLQTYLSHAIRLQRCLDVVYLDPEFRREVFDSGRIKEWLQGNEKDPKALLALCHKWSITKSKNHQTVSCNVMNGRGGVERWTFRLHVDKFLSLDSFEVQLLQQDGTFFNQSGNAVNLLRI